MCVCPSVSVPVFANSTNDVPPSGQIQFAPIIVNGRTLTGPNSSAHRRDGRLLIPVSAISRALGDVISIDAPERSISVRRQTGLTAEFNASQGRVSENGALTLMVSNAGEIVFSPNVDELLLPVEITAALFDVAIRYDNTKNAVLVTRGQSGNQLTHSTKGQRVADIYQVNYEYNLNRYSSGGSQNLVLSAVGRLADGRFNFNTSSSSSTMRHISLRNAAFALERPNGQHYLAGDFGTGSNLQFLATNVRGGSASVPFGGTVVTAFAGRSFSGVFRPVGDPILENEPLIVVRDRFRYDTNIVGVFATTNSAANRKRVSPFTFSGGAERFSGSQRSGDLVSGSVNYDVSRLRVQGDLAFGKFTGRRADNSQFTGNGAAIDLSGTFQVTDSLGLQARFTHIGQNFLSPQTGLREPVDLKAAGITWSPKKWLSTSVSASTARRPGDVRQNNKFVTAAFAITPSAGLPRFYVSHTESSTSQVRSAAFTLLNASKEYSRLRLFLNATRIAGPGPVSMNAQFGANFSINDRNSFEASQGVGRRGSLNGQFDWRTSNLLNHRLSFTAGAGYSHNQTSGFSKYERLSASLNLPRQTSLQLNYYQTNQGATMLVSLRGSLFRKHEASAFLDSSVSTMNAYGKVSGRVYQDVNLNGLFDAGVDTPQAEVKVRVDGNRYVVTDENGLFRFDSV